MLDKYVMHGKFVHMSLPPFTADGLLPAGDYPLTLDELRSSVLVRGPTNRGATWDSEWRLELVERLALVAKQLWTVGIDDIFIDGSFTEDKDHPNDIDGYFVCDLAELASGRLEDALNRLDPHKVWTWNPDSRRPYKSYPKHQLPMWHAYRIELYPHYGQPAGICDEHGYELEFPSAFRISRRDGHPRGIVKLMKGDAP